MFHPTQEHVRALDLERAEHLLKGVIIPPRPETLVAVLEVQKVEEPDLERLGTLIASDVALAAGTLKVVNSPFFGLPRRVSSIHHAVRLLGPSNIVNIVTGLMLHSAFGDGRGDLMHNFWDAAERLGMIAAQTARMAGGCEPHEAYVAGLFADCGVPLLARRFHDYGVVFRAGQSTTTEPVTVYEDRAIGTDHTLAGFLVARSWKLPETYCQCILRHHEATDVFTDEAAGESTRLLAIVMMALHVCRALSGAPLSHEWNAVGAAVEAYLGIAADTVEAETVALLAAATRAE